jgi:UrcA family protein
MEPCISKRCALIGLLSAGLTSSLALAAPPDGDVKSVVVRYSDLDLSQPAGARVLYRRIRVAAKQACEDLNGHDLALYARYHRCLTQAVAGAVHTVNSTRVSELHRNERFE